MTSVSNWDEKVRHSLDQQLPASLLSQIETQLYATRASIMLSERSSSEHQLSLIGILARDLKSLGNNLPNTVATQVDLLAAELRLYSLPLLSRSITGPDKTSNPLSKATWYKGFRVALQIVEVFSKSIQQSSLITLAATGDCPPTTCDIITAFFPKHYFRVLVMAGMYLLNLLIVDREIAEQDEVVARSRVREVYEALRYWSQQDMDESDRAARMIELLSRHVDDLRLCAQPEEETDNSRGIIAQGMKIARKIRSELQASAGQGGYGQQPSEFSFDPSASFVGLQLGSVYLWGVDLPLDWESWLSDADPIVGLLESQPDHVPMNTI